MQIKKTLLLASFITLTSFSHLANADTASRCMALMDKRVKANVLELSNCNLSAKDAPTILNYLNTHPAITELNVNDNPNFGSEGITELAKTTSLQTLSLSNSNVREPGFAALAKNTSIKTLIDTKEERYNDSNGYQKTLQGNTVLTSVDFSWQQANADVIKTLATLPTLEEIQLSHPRYFREDELLALKNLPKLKKLNVVYGYCSDITLASLASNPNLVEFGANAGPKTLQAIIKNKTLQKISLAADGTETTLQDLKNNQTITSLTLYGFLTNDTIATIASMSNLVELNLNFIASTADQSAADNLYLLANLPKLEKLSISAYYTSLEIDNRTANALAMNTSLKELQIDNLGESAGFELAKSMSLKRLNIQNITPRCTDDLKFILNKSLAALAKIPSLTELGYNGNFTIDADVASAIASNPNLKMVHINRDSIMSEITAPALAIFTKAPYLTDLKLSSDNINDAATTAFAANTTLQRLNLESAHITAKGIYALSRNQTLTALTLAIKPINASAYNALLANQAITYLDIDVDFESFMKKVAKKSH